jgi:hypothetical protein
MLTQTWCNEIEGEEERVRIRMKRIRMERNKRWRRIKKKKG